MNINSDISRPILHSRGLNYRRGKPKKKPIPDGPSPICARCNLPFPRTLHGENKYCSISCGKLAQQSEEPGIEVSLARFRAFMERRHDGEPDDVRVGWVRVTRRV